MYIDLFSGIYEKYDMEKCIRDAKRIGYESVQIRCFGNEGLEIGNDTQLAEIKKLLDETGIKVSCLYSITGQYGRKENDEECEKQLVDLEWICKAAEKLDAEYIMHMDGLKTDSDETALQKVASWYGKAADLAAKYSKKLVMEIHNGGYIQSVEGVFDLKKRIGRDNVGFIHDATNMYICGEDSSPEALEKLYPHIWIMHVKNMAEVKDANDPDPTIRELYGKKWKYTYTDEGDVDFGSLLGILKRKGFSGPVTLENHRKCDDGVQIAEKEYEIVSEIIEKA